MPNFVNDNAWSYDRKLDQGRTTPLGFDLLAARAAVQFNGFYVFEPFD